MMQHIRGKVIEGKKRGKDLGFPTANIKVHRPIEEGIYLAKVRIKEESKPSTSSGNNSSLSKRSASKGLQVYNALTFIGRAITFNEKEIFVESYLLDFSGNLYGKYLTITLLQKLRDNKKFESVEELQKQMNEDLANARKFFTPWC